MLDQSLLDREFPQDNELIYLNHAAVTPWPLRTANVVKDFANENVRFGALNYKSWSQKVMELRGQLQQLLNAPSRDDIALLKNTSEALSVVACGIDWQWGDNVISTDEEFPSNRIPWEAQRRYGVAFREVSIRQDDPEQALIEACDARTRVLTVSSVQYGSGIRLDLVKLGDFCRHHKILFCVDAIQSIGAHQFDVQAIQADFAMADAHKWMLGPEGIAVFYCRPELRYELKLQQYGWHMVQNAGDYDNKEWRPAASARRFECGTANMLGIYALSASLSLIIEIGMQNIEQQILSNTAYLIENLKKYKFFELLTPAHSQRHAGIVTFQSVQHDMKEMHHKLLQNKVICAHRRGGIRFSPHFYTPRIKIDKALEILSLTI